MQTQPNLYFRFHLSSKWDILYFSQLSLTGSLAKSAETEHVMQTMRKHIAFAVAVCADLIQVGLPYLFAEGFLSPFNDFLDVAVCAVLSLLIGWHIAFIPSFLLESVPIANLAPTWTIAFFIATYHRQASASEGESPSESQPVVYDEKGRPLQVSGHDEAGARKYGATLSTRGRQHE